MKKPLHILRPAVLIVIGLMLALASAAVGQPIALRQAGTPTVTVTPPAVASSEIGSTDGLVFLSVIIVIIILAPMFLHWKTWLRKS